MPGPFNCAINNLQDQAKKRSQPVPSRTLDPKQLAVPRRPNPKVSQTATICSAETANFEASKQPTQCPSTT